MRRAWKVLAAGSLIGLSLTLPGSAADRKDDRRDDSRDDSRAGRRVDREGRPAPTSAPASRPSDPPATARPRDRRDPSGDPSTRADRGEGSPRRSQSDMAADVLARQKQI